MTIINRRRTLLEEYFDDPESQAYDSRTLRVVAYKDVFDQLWFHTDMEYMGCCELHMYPFDDDISKDNSEKVDSAAAMVAKILDANLQFSDSEVVEGNVRKKFLIMKLNKQYQKRRF